MELSHKTRTFLAQLRSDDCARLNSYKHQLNSKQFVTSAQHDAAQYVTHLFERLMNLTNLTLVDFWLRAKEVAEFLNVQWL